MCVRAGVCVCVPMCVCVCVCVLQLLQLLFWIVLLVLVVCGIGFDCVRITLCLWLQMQVPSTNGCTWWETNLSLPKLSKTLWSTHSGVPLGLGCTSPSPSKAHRNKPSMHFTMTCTTAHNGGPPGVLTEGKCSLRQTTNCHWKGGGEAHFGARKIKIFFLGP